MSASVCTVVNELLVALTVVGGLRLHDRVAVHALHRGHLCLHPRRILHRPLQHLCR